MGNGSYNHGSLVSRISRYVGQETALIDAVSPAPDHETGLTVAARCSLAWPGKDKDNIEDRGRPVAWSHAGVVERVHSSLRRWTPGERVSGIGYGITASSRSVFIPADLAAKVPQNVSFEEAVFCAPGALAVRAVKLAGSKKGMTVAVIGQALVCRLACMLLALRGCRVLVLDGNSSRTDTDGIPGVYRAYPIEQDSASMIRDATTGDGVDAVIIAAGLESTDLIEIAGLICRRQGIVVSVGSAGQDQSCGIYSERKLKLRATGSFHPGPMDSAGGGQTGDRSYEGNVFTEEDDQKSFMSLISRGAIEVGSLISHNFGIGRIEEAREIMSRYRKDECQCVIFNYDRRVKRTGSKLAMPGWSSIRPGRGSQISMGLIGVDDVDSEAEGVLAENEAGQSGFEVIRSEAENLIKEPTIDSVYIANIRNQYAEWVVKSLLSGKATFVDGCLCMREEEMEQIEAARLAAGAPLMVGYRRRFAPLAAKAREIVRGRRYPLSLHYRINRQPTISSDPYRNPQDDCRPIMDEMCNHVDLLSYLVGGWPVRIHAEALSMPDDKYRCDDNLQVIIRFSEGSVGTINYVTSGNQLIASEYLEIMGDGMVIQLDDFRSLIIASEGKIRKSEATVRDTGKMRMLRLWHYYLVTGLGSPIPFDVIRDASLASLGIIESLSEGNSAKLTD